MCRGCRSVGAAAGTHPVPRPATAKKSLAPELPGVGTGSSTVCTVCTVVVLIARQAEREGKRKGDGYEARWDEME